MPTLSPSPSGARPKLAPPPPPLRAPALYVVGYVAERSEPEMVFRLPCPPRWDDQPLGVSAGEPRVRKAYYSTLDTLRTGVVPADRAAKLTRLTRAVRSERARAGLEHLRRVLRFVRWSAGGWPVIPSPSSPLAKVVITAPLVGADWPTEDDLADEYAWPLDWMRMHRWVVGRGLVVEWRVQDDPRRDVPAVVPVAAEPGLTAMAIAPKPRCRTAFV